MQGELMWIPNILPGRSPKVGESAAPNECPVASAKEAVASQEATFALDEAAAGMGTEVVLGAATGAAVPPNMPEPARQPAVPSQATCFDGLALLRSPSRLDFWGLGVLRDSEYGPVLSGDRDRPLNRPSLSSRIRKPMMQSQTHLATRPVVAFFVI